MKYAPYGEYKPSSLPWLGHIPTGWNVWKVAHGFQMTGSGTTPPSDNLDWYEGDVCWITTGELREQLIYDTERKVSIDALKAFSALKVFPPGALAVAMYGATIGRLGILGIEAATNQACCVLYGEKSFDTRFVFYWLQAIRDQVILMASGGGQPNISQEKVRSLRIACPSVSEQQSIARFLDAKTSKIDGLIAKKRQLIDKLKEKRQSLIGRSVTRGLPTEVAKAASMDSNPEMKDSGIEWLKKIPSHWSLWPLKRIVSTPITDGPHETPEFLIEGIPFVSAEAVQDGRVVLTSMRGYISKEDHQSYSKKYYPRKRDIFVVKSGSTTGKVAIVDFDDDFNVWSPLAAIRCDTRKAVPEYLFYALSSEYFQGLVKVSWSFGTQPNIGMGVIGNLVVPLPPVSEQRLIADFLGMEASRFNRLINQSQTAIDRLAEYRQALITSAVTGKIDVRNAA